MCQEFRISLIIEKPEYVREFVFVQEIDREKMLLSLLIFQSISLIVGTISFKRPRPTDACVRNLVWLLVIMICITKTYKVPIIKPNVKIIKTSWKN